VKLHNQELGPYRIFAEGLDGDGVPFSKGNADHWGVEFPDPDREGITVFVPWGRVESIEAGEETVPEPDEVEPVSEDLDDPNEVGTNAVQPPGGEKAVKAEPKTDTKADTGKGDPQASKAKEWANDDPATIRAWAKENNVPVSDAGPIPKATLAKYAAAKSS